MMLLMALMNLRGFISPPPSSTLLQFLNVKQVLPKVKPANVMKPRHLTFDTSLIIPPFLLHLYNI